VQKIVHISKSWNFIKFIILCSLEYNKFHIMILHAKILALSTSRVFILDFMKLTKLGFKIFIRKLL
jgi:hypothetical protein